MRKVEISRDSASTVQTLGQLNIYEDNNIVYSCKTLELPWKNNEKRVSCIPEGQYKVVKRNSAKYGDHFHITNVDNRDYILIHSGNYHTQILGCVLVGKQHVDINGDGNLDVSSSKPTMAELNQQLPDEFDMVVWS